MFWSKSASLPPTSGVILPQRRWAYPPPNPPGYPLAWGLSLPSLVWHCEGPWPSSPHSSLPASLFLELQPSFIQHPPCPESVPPPSTSWSLPGGSLYRKCPSSHGNSFNSLLLKFQIYCSSSSERCPITQQINVFVAVPCRTPSVQEPPGASFGPCVTSLSVPERTALSHWSLSWLIPVSLPKFCERSIYYISGYKQLPPQ